MHNKMRQLNQLNIFIVDDDVFYQNCLQKLLVNLGCEKISAFSNGVQALSNIQENPDVVFLDHNMDIMSGYEVLNKIKRVNPNIHVIMVSSQEEISVAVNSLKHGAFDYIQKGADDEPERIELALQRLLELDDLLQRSQPKFLNKLFQYL